MPIRDKASCTTRSYELRDTFVAGTLSTVANRANSYIFMKDSYERSPFQKVLDIVSCGTKGGILKVESPKIHATGKLVSLEQVISQEHSCQILSSL